MQNTTSLGMNRTGAQMSPLAVQSMQSFADENSPPPDDPMAEPAITAVRSDYVHEAEAVGSVPLPGTLTGAVTTGMAKLTGRKPEVLVDKLGERLAFERTGVRLYQAFIDKVSASEDIANLPFTLADLEHNRDEELEHLQMVTQALQSLGADPTAQTPCADVLAVASGGIMQVLTDPRTTIPQCLAALQTAELTDNAGWELLILLADQTGQQDLLAGFRRALAHEQEHAQRVHDWMTQMVLEEAS